MSNKGTGLLRLSIATPMLAALAACVTAAPPKTASDVSCALFAPISYAQLPAGQVDDPGNRADSDATVQEIDRHNARFDTVCGNPLAPPG